MAWRRDGLSCASAWRMCMLYLVVAERGGQDFCVDFLLGRAGPVMLILLLPGAQQCSGAVMVWSTVVLLL